MTYTNNALVELLIYRVGNDEYGLDMAAVEAIRPYDLFVALPEARVPTVAGALCKHADIPFIDLRIKFQTPHQLGNPRAAIMVIRSTAGSVAFAVDSVNGFAFVPRAFSA